MTTASMFQKSPALPLVELRQVHSSSICYQTHSHDEFSFGAIDSGQARYQNLKDLEHIVQNQVVTINPGDAHSCNPKEGNWSYRMLFVEADYFSQLQQEIFQTKGHDYLPFANAVSNNHGSLSQFDQLFLALCGSDYLLAESKLIDFIEQEFGYENNQRNQRAFNKDALRADLGKIVRVEEMIMDSLHHNFSLQSFADEIGLSRYHLVRSFKEAYGQSPHAFQLDQRIKKAKKLLQSGESLLDTALSLGFSDQSHFQRHFKKRIAITPLQYQRCFT